MYFSETIMNKGLQSIQKNKIKKNKFKIIIHSTVKNKFSYAMKLAICG
jgi:hypothetical protein